METATFGGGCFWCTEAVFTEMQGVHSATSGYMGGRVANPTYEHVCMGNTGHAEVVQITYDPALVSFRDLLLVWFSVHDPTTKDRQGADVGSQYRSVIFYHSEEQRREAEEFIRELEAEKIWPAPIVTEIQPAGEFYRAEDYHQDYFRNNPSQPYCRMVVEPKVSKFRTKFADRLKQ